jgi:hypothetical protein
LACEAYRFSSKPLGISGGKPGTFNGAAVGAEAISRDNIGTGIDVIAMDSDDQIGIGIECPGRPEGEGGIGSAALKFGPHRTIQKKGGIHESGVNRRMKIEEDLQGSAGGSIFAEPKETRESFQ